MTPSETREKLLELAEYHQEKMQRAWDFGQSSQGEYHKAQVSILRQVAETMKEGWVSVPERVAKATKFWTYCPMQGGYKDGPAIEDTCEELAGAVEEWTGVDRSDEWLTVEQTEAMLAARPK